LRRQGLGENIFCLYSWAPDPFQIKAETMNAPTDLSMKNDDVLRVELEVFRRQHRDLDQAIAALVERGTGDQLTLKRLKKQ